MKRIIAIAALAALPMLAQPALAADEVNVTTGISAGGAPLAVHGVDPVALLSGKQVVAGSSDFNIIHEGASYYFASQANLDAFTAEPAKFAPQHGGFCSFGVSVGKKFNGDPSQFLVQDGRLFLFLNSATRDAFLKDTAGNAVKADTFWGDIKHTAAADL